MVKEKRDKTQSGGRGGEGEVPALAHLDSVNGEDLHAARLIREANLHVDLKTTRTKQR